MNITYHVILSEATLAPHVICLANYAGENLYYAERDSSVIALGRYSLRVTLYL
jgi:hypothetical protein